MTELNAKGTKQRNDSTTEGGAGVAHAGGGSRPVTGAGRRMGEGGASSREASEPGEHPNRVDGSESPESGDALLENHESGVWNKEREAEEGGGNQGDKRAVQPAPPGAGGNARPKDQPGNAPKNNRKGGGTGKDDRAEVLRSGSGRSQNQEESGRSSDGDGMAEDGGRRS